MYQFLLNLWLMNKITEQQVDLAVTKGLITQEQGNTIKNTPR